MICALVIASHLGGSIPATEAAIEWLAASGCEVRIEGDCASACTMLLDVGCVTPDARLGFHRAKSGSASGDAYWTGRMADHLPKRLRAWYLDGPAGERRPTWISGSDAVRMGARLC